MNSSGGPTDPFHESTTNRYASGESAAGPVRFSLGQTVFHGKASVRLRTEEVLTALRRHSRGDWGDLLPEDAIANDLAVKQGGRLFSAYGLGRDRFWVITEADRALTTVCMADDG
ncbi:MAG TPA: hypothetical protein VNX28_10020 [Gemmataceae bacterium]|jgi:hypothetical protein|nr:hypothetical protein [Gemmataceae bacterium]